MLNIDTSMKLNKANIKTNIYCLFILISIIINMIIFPDLIVVHIFLLFYVILIYIKFNMDFDFVQVCMLLLFSIINSSFYFNIAGHIIYYFYILIAIYYVNLIYVHIMNLGIYQSILKLKTKYIYIFSFINLYVILSILLADNKIIALSSATHFILIMLLLEIYVIEVKKSKHNVKFIDYFILLSLGILTLGSGEILGIRYGLKSSFEVAGFTIQMFPHIKRVPIVFFYNPNNYSVFLVILMIVLIARYVYSKNKQSKLYNGLIYLLALMNLIFSMCRTAWISLIVTLIFAVIFCVLHKERKKSLILFNITAITLIILYGFSYLTFMKPYYGKLNNMPKIDVTQINEDIIDDNTLQIGKKGSVNVRMTLIYDVINGIFKERRYLGFGAGNTSLYVKSLNNTFGVYSIHSFWLEILGDFGVLIFMLILFIYLYVCIKLIVIYNKSDEKYRQYSFMLGLLMLSLVFLTFAPSSVMNFPIFWIALGGTLGFILNK